ncbi:hypothetical protein [Leeuwenhoekiella sp. NPDC079379]|uniref:hypothetical protein n=1 Tax=Leeuwenhoekiella sp. NPDC079379 TaxID=3364122 RepID=UPI0037C975EA
MKELIHFKKQRELGDILSDTFKFLRLEYKPLFKALMRNAAIPFIILIAISAYFNTLISDFSELTSGNFDVSVMLLSILGMFIALLFYYAILYGTILNYIKLYIKNDGNVNPDVLNTNVRNSLGNLTGLSFLSAMLLMAGFVLCILPGVYISVPLSLTFAILVFNDKSAVDAISDSFRLVKGEWWMTFATILVMGLLLYVANIVFSVPVIIYSLVKTFTSADQISQGDMSSMIDWVYITLNAISTAIQYILAGVYAIAIAFIYFNLNEKINQTGTFETIDSIGSDL